MSDVSKEAAEAVPLLERIAYEQFHGETPDDEALRRYWESDALSWLIWQEPIKQARFLRAKLEAAVPAKVVEGATGESRAIRDGWNDCRAKLGLGGE